MPSRNAVTFSGKPSPVSARIRSVHSESTVRADAARRAISWSSSREVSFAGERRAWWRISSE
jgi:hypothetical protein